MGPSGWETVRSEGEGSPRSWLGMGVRENVAGYVAHIGGLRSPLRIASIRKVDLFLTAAWLFNVPFRVRCRSEPMCE